MLLNSNNQIYHITSSNINKLVNHWCIHSFIMYAYIVALCFELNQILFDISALPSYVVILNLPH